MNSDNKLDKRLTLSIAVVLASLIMSCSKKSEDQATVPVLTTNNVTQITTMKAMGGGTISSDGGSAVTVRGVCWSEFPNPTITDASSNDGSTGTGSYTTAIYGLTGGKVYHTRAFATNSEGTSYGDDKIFTSDSVSFTTVTLSPDIIDTASVRLNGRVYPNNESVIVTFEYGPTVGYGATITASQSPVTGNTEVIVSAEIAGLTPGIVYHFRVRSDYSNGGTENGSDETFSPNGKMPDAEVTGVTDIISVSATAHGAVNANYLSTIVSVEYGTTIAYGQMQVINQNPVTGNSPEIVSAYLEGLEPLATYHYRFKAENSLGVGYSEDATFSTQYTPGEHYFGGIIFYLDNTGEHGLVCAEQSQGIFPWATMIYSLTGATATGIGSGFTNTNTIVASLGSGEYAAKICSDLVLNGYDDWFLPSQEELTMMRPYLDGAYNWSSSEIDDEHAWLNYYNGYHYYVEGYKNGPQYVRAARAF
jgi:hypothetical protein